MSVTRWLIASFVTLSLTTAGRAEDFSGKDLSGRKFASQRLEGANFEDAVLKNADFAQALVTNANFQGADLTSASLNGGDFTGSDFRGARLTDTSIFKTVLNNTNFEGADFSKLIVSYAKLREANLRNLKAIGPILDTDFYKADLRGANLTGMTDSTRASSFRKAIYDKHTRWPKDFDVAASGAVLVEEGEETSDPKALVTKLTKEFAKLDRNEDGWLSGVEAEGLEKLDANKNGRITFQEFLEAKTAE